MENGPRALGRRQRQRRPRAQERARPRRAPRRSSPRHQDGPEEEALQVPGMVPHRGASCPRPLPNAEKKKEIRNTPRVARKSARPSTEVRKPRGAAPDVPNGTRHPEHPRTPARSSQNTSPSTFLDPPAQAAASGILVACVVAAAVAPFSTVGPGRAVDRETAVMMREHMGSDDADPPHPFADHDAVRLAPLTPGRFARALAPRRLSDGRGPRSWWWSPPSSTSGTFPGASVESSVPAWARPDPVKDPYVVSDLYQRRFEAAPGFVPNRAYETAVYLKFVVDHYENLPDVTAFVRGDFHRDVADAKQRLVRVANRAAGVAYQPLDIPETTKDDVVALGLVESRSPGELVQMWKDERWGWEGIMGDTAGPPPRTSAGVGGTRREFGEFTVDEKEEEKRSAALSRERRERASRSRAAERPPVRARSVLLPHVRRRRGDERQGDERDFRGSACVPVVSEEDKAELFKSVTVSAYRGGNFAVSRERLTRVPLARGKAVRRPHARRVPRGGERDGAARRIRDSFDLGVQLEHLASSSAASDRAGEAARCCGATCVPPRRHVRYRGRGRKDGASDDAMPALRRPRRTWRRLRRKCCRRMGPVGFAPSARRWTRRTRPTQPRPTARPTAVRQGVRQIV